jgi:hypothetical protein
MDTLTALWEWCSKPSAWVILLAFFIAGRITMLLGRVAKELRRRRQRGIEHLIPAQGYKAKLYVGVQGVSETRNRARRLVDDYDYRPVLAWGLRQDGRVTGYVHTEAGGVVQAETLPNFEYYVPEEYVQQIIEIAKRIWNEDAT